MTRDLLRSVSLAGLCLMTSWIELHFVGGGSALYLPSAPSRADHVAAILLTLALTTGFFAATRAARLFSPGAQVILGLFGAAAVAAVAVNGLRIYTLPVRLGGLPSRHLRLTLAALVVALVVAGLVARRWWRPAHRVAAVAPLLLLPFTLWMCARSAVAAATARVVEVNPTLAGPLAVRGSEAAAVWVIFDELDYGLAFARRPLRVDLPEFDRLRRESLFATDARPAGSHTLVAMTSIIVSQRLLSVEPETAADFTATPAGGGAPVASKQARSLFRRVREHGHDTWVTGWALPYCRTWAADLSGCSWEPAFTSVLGRSRTILGSFADQAYAMSPLNRRRLAVDGYLRVVAAAEERLRHPKPGLLLIHLPVPHPPPIFDAEKGRLTTWETSPLRGYLGNLELADRTLGRLRRAMEESGTWSRTTVLVTADHPWRQSQLMDGQKDRRIPFILRLADQENAAVYDRELDCVRTGPLLLAILDRRLVGVPDVTRWLDQK